MNEALSDFYDARRPAPSPVVTAGGGTRQSGPRKNGLQSSSSLVPPYESPVVKKKIKQEPGSNSNNGDARRDVRLPSDAYEEDVGSNATDTDSKIKSLEKELADERAYIQALMAENGDMFQRLKAHEDGLSQSHPQSFSNEDSVNLRLATIESMVQTLLEKTSFITEAMGMSPSLGEQDQQPRVNTKGYPPSFFRKTVKKAGPSSLLRDEGSDTLSGEAAVIQPQGLANEDAGMDPSASGDSSAMQVDPTAAGHGSGSDSVMPADDALSSANGNSLASSVSSSLPASTKKSSLRRKTTTTTPF